MNQERIIPAINLSVEDGKKQLTQEWVRRSIIPKLIERSFPSEKALRVLHYASTWKITNRDQSAPIQQYETILKDGGFLKGKTRKESRKFIRDVSHGNNPDIKVNLAPPKGRGEYRLLGKVEYGKDGHQSAKVDFWRRRGIQIITREGDRVYFAPQQKVDFLMQNLCQSYDELEKDGNDPVKVALRLAFFYSIGNKIIHPFLDGNHRAFDRFLEYGFAKASMEFKLPQDKSGNIPVEEQFRVVTTALLINLLRTNSLPLFTYDPPENFYSTYQQKLVNITNELINQKLSDPFYLYLYAIIAEELLKWTQDPHTQEISALQEKAKADGGFTVIHRKK